MKNITRHAAAAALTAIISGGAILPLYAQAAPFAPAVSIQQTAATNSNTQAEQAVQHFVSTGVLSGYEDGTLRADILVTNAELIKMILLALQAAQGEEARQSADDKAHWYTAYLEAAAASGIVDSPDQLQPNQPAVRSDVANIIAKALQRDAKSVHYWMESLGIDDTKVTRGQTAQLLALSENALRSEAAEIVSIKALNKITLEVTFTSPLTLEDEATAAANDNFAFDHELKLVNQPRLKTGAIATYIVPVQTMTEGTTYTTNYKGKKTHTVTASAEKIQLKTARQVTSDTFEVDSFLSDGVVDYGYLISAYAGGRGANAIVVDENNTYQGQPVQIISSLASRQAIFTPEGGSPITVNYVGFTQSTDGKQEPKFRLPAGASLMPGVTYTVTLDWFELENNTFTAQAVSPLVIAAVAKVNPVTLNVALSEDPGDELFAYRSIQLKGSDGRTLTAQYKVQTRKGEVGVFELQNNDKLVDGVSYEIIPVGDWAIANQVTLISQ
jgi:hypothetical protein